MRVHGEEESLRRVALILLDNAIKYELAAREGPWQHSNLTQAAAAPPAEISLLSAFVWEPGRSKHVASISGDGHIHELRMALGGSWSHDDVTEQTGAPEADGTALAGFGWRRGSTRQIVYKGEDGHIYELVAGVDHAWRSADLTRLTSSSGRTVSASAQ